MQASVTYYQCPACGQTWSTLDFYCECNMPYSRCCHRPLVTCTTVATINSPVNLTPAGLAFLVSVALLALTSLVALVGPHALAAFAAP